MNYQIENIENNGIATKGTADAGVSNVLVLEVWNAGYN